MELSDPESDVEFQSYGHALFKLDGPVKSQKPDGFEKSSSYGAQISRSEAYLCTPQRLRDAAQRRKWTFCGTVNLVFGE
jgi:hypothetical protein